MRRSALLLLLLCTAINGFAAKRVTVAELHDAIASMNGKPDADIAFRIADMELSERLSAAQYEKLFAELPGTLSKQALLGLADRSEFLDPPLAELPKRSAPTITEQREMMARVVNYVSKVIPQLPNFLATRTTFHFEDTPQSIYAYRPLHEIGQDEATVSYRDGHEVVERVSKKEANPLTRGLQTAGIFGPFLGRVLVDAAQSTLRWGHWEAGPHDEAVFAFEVPKEKSHYEVDYCCVTNETATSVADTVPYRKVVSYHGEMTIDPADGRILRLVVVADLERNAPVVRSAIMVKYGQVVIGGKEYTCPTRSVSQVRGLTFELDRKYHFALANRPQPLRTVLDDVTFSKYHVFRSESRILTATTTPGNPTESSSPARTAQQSGMEVAVAASVSDGSEQVQQRPGQTKQKAAEAVPSPSQAAKSSAQPEISVEAATKLPDDALASPGNDLHTRVTFHATTRLVDVGVVAFDKKGNPITSLKADDFEILDNGVEQKVRFFSRAGENAAEGSVQLAQRESVRQEPAVFSNRQAYADNADVRSRSFQSNTTILLIDASHLAFGDLSYAREEVLRFLKDLTPDDRVGLYVLRSYGFQVLQEPTTDFSIIQEKLTGWMPNSEDLARAQEEEMRNRHQMEYVDTANDLLAVNGNTPQSHSGMFQPKDPNLRASGNEPGRDTLALFPILARHLAVIDGHKSLIWIASDNVLADWTDNAAKVDRGVSQLAPLLLHAQEALNQAHVSIYPLDASQLEVGGVSADKQNANVQLNPVGQGAPGPASTSRSSPGEMQELNEAFAKSVRNQFGGRATDTMKQVLHPISGDYREIAEATGGRALRRAGDITNELRGILEDGRAAYLLSFTPSLPADDKYHTITVKVKDQKDIQLRYRTGYLAAKEPESLKARFEEAIWSPKDAYGISLRATPAEDAVGTLIELNIAGPDLDLKQDDSRWIDKLDIFLVERSEEGLHAKVSGQTLGLRLLPGTYQHVMKGGVDFNQRIDAWPKDTDLRIVVVDENSWRIGSVTIPAGQVNAAESTKKVNDGGL